MIMLSMTTQRKEPIAGLFSLEDISYVKQYSLCFYLVRILALVKVKLYKL